MLDISEIDSQTLCDIMENLDTENELDVAGLSAGEAIDRFLIWNGICGYTGQILDAVDTIRAADAVMEIRGLLSDIKDIDDTFIDVVNCLDHHGHMGNQTLKLCCLASRQALTPTGRSLALLKIREVIG